MLLKRNINTAKMLCNRPILAPFRPPGTFIYKIQNVSKPMPMLLNYPIKTFASKRPTLLSEDEETELQEILKNEWLIGSMDYGTLRRKYFEEKMTYIGAAALINGYTADDIVQLLNEDAARHFYGKELFFSIHNRNYYRALQFDREFETFPITS